MVSLVLLSSAQLAAGSPFRNTHNRPFASRCNGPQGAIVIADGGVGTAEARRSAVLRQHSEARLVHAQASLERLKRRALPTLRARPRFPRLVVHTAGGRIVAPDLAQAAQAGTIGSPTNDLKFEFVGWSEPELAALRSYLPAAYAKARVIYGPPAFNITVRIIRDDSISELQGGLYDATLNEIRMPSLTDNLPEDTFILLLLVLRAFHDDIAFFYDAWEEGFVGAAATAIQVQPGVSPLFDPKDPGPLYALSVYEAENHPELANSTFYPESGFGGMLVWRIAMARAAWLKCWIEDPGFFAAFNQLYYQNFTESLPGDVLSLRELAATVLPFIEGIPFQEWFQRQYVLDTSVHSGLKEYTWNIPLENAVALITEHYVTDDAGNEFPRGGQGRATYWNYDFSYSLYAEEGNLIDIPATGDTPGEGFLLPTFFNIGGPQRITVQIDLNGLRSYYPYPYGVRGFEAGENNLYGAVLNETSGSITVTGGAPINDLPVRRGVWGSRVTTGDLGPLKLVATLTNANGQQVTRQVNVGWDSYMVLLDGGRQETLTHTFLRGTNGIHLMSLPLSPTVGSAAEVLGLPERDLLLARWDPSAPPDGAYRIWPNCPPFALGRAFWLRVPTDLPVVVTGVAAPRQTRVLVPLELGWNMVGSPRSEPVRLSDLRVTVGTDPPMTLAEAADRRHLQAGIFRYVQGAGYQLVEDALLPFEGYWVRVLNPAGCNLAFEPIASTVSTRSSDPLRNLPTPDWKLRLVASAGQADSCAVYLGEAPSATAASDPLWDYARPPVAASGVQLYFPAGEGNKGVPYLTDVRGPDPATRVWDLEVASDIPDQPVTITWPDLSGIPGDLAPLLIDPATGQRIAMRTTASYRLPATEQGVRRRLRVELPPRRGGTLVISALSATFHRQGLQVVYSLSSSGSSDVRVLNMAGRTVRRLLANEPQSAGVNVVPWNLRDDRGSVVPNGSYLVEVRVRGADGQQVSAVRPVRVVRQ